MAHRFEMGRVVSTPMALEVLQAAGVHPYSLVLRHVSGDWGDLCGVEDAAENEFSIGRDLRIMSFYSVGDESVWVITEADRSSTCLMLGREY